jgi:ferredoxin-type protein NapF
MTAPALSRRAFLRVGPDLKATPARPPWALAEAAFRDVCTRCGDCVAACPEQILALARDGWPTRLLQAGECTWCGDCERACGPRALNLEQRPASTLLATIGPGCLTADGIVCQGCRDACPERALEFVPARVAAPRLRPDRCSGCGACVPVCPTGAIALVECGSGDGRAA